MIEKLEENNLNADTNVIIKKVNELVEVVNKPLTFVAEVPPLEAVSEKPVAEKPKRGRK